MQTVSKVYTILAKTQEFVARFSFKKSINSFYRQREHVTFERQKLKISKSVELAFNW